MLLSPCQPHQRDRLERLCRYVTQPPLALDRLAIEANGRVIYELKHPSETALPTSSSSPWNFWLSWLLWYPDHGPISPATMVFWHPMPSTANSWCPHPTGAQRKNASTGSKLDQSPPSIPIEKPTIPVAPLSWAERLKRVFKIDIELCPRCGGKLRVIAAITQPDAIQKILDHVHQQQAPPSKPPGRVSGPINTQIQFDAI